MKDIMKEENEKGQQMMERHKEVKMNGRLMKGN